MGSEIPWRVVGTRGHGVGERLREPGVPVVPGPDHPPGGRRPPLDLLEPDSAVRYRDHMQSCIRCRE